MAGKALHGSSLKPYWLLALVGSSAAAQAADGSLNLPGIDESLAFWSPHLYSEIKLGNQRNIGTIGAMLPLTQRADSLLFADVRGRSDDDQSREYNLGLGFRWSAGDDLLLGTYGYYDTLRSSRGNTFRQTTLGLEVQSASYSARINRYQPTGRRAANVGGVTEQASNGDGQPQLQIVDAYLTFVSEGSEIVQLQGQELSLKGHDLELGYYLPVADQDIALFAGYYEFDGSGAERISGPRVRAQWNMPIDSLKAGSSLSLGAEWQHDDVRGTNSYLSLGITIPLGNSSKSSARSGTDWRRDRMMAAPVRDVDVVVADVQKQISSTNLPAVNELALYDTGESIGRVVFAEAGAAGSGTQADPAALGDALGQLETGSVLVMSNAGGDFAGGGNLSAASVQVLSGGASVNVIGAVTPGLTGVFSAPAGNARLAGQLAVSGDNVTVRNLQMDGGFSASGITDLTLDGGSASSLDFTGNSGEIRLRNLTAGGLSVDGGDADLLFESGSLARTTAGQLVTVSNISGGRVEVGVDMSASGAASGLLLENNSGGEIIFSGAQQSLSTGSNDAVRLIDNSGAEIRFSGDSLDIQTSGGSGFHASGGGTLSLTGSNSISSNGAGSALHLEDMQIGTDGFALDSLSSTNAAAEGVLLDGVSGSLDLGDVQIEQATTDGIAILDSSADVSFGDVVIDQVGSDGIRLAGSSGELTFADISITDAGDVGVNFEDSEVDFTADRLDIDGAVTAIDLTRAQGVITVTQGGNLSNFSDTGVQFSNTDDLADTADALFTFAGGSIVAGAGGFVMDGVGLDPNSGLYDFTGTTLTGDFRFSPGAGQVGDLYFVAATATGAGDGSSINDLASAADAQARADGGLATTFVFVNDGDVIDFSALTDGTFRLSAGQAITGFANGNSLSLDIPANIIGLPSDLDITDPTGNGAAQLTSSTGNVITAGDDTRISHVAIVGGDSAVHASGTDSLLMYSTLISGIYNHALSLSGVTGSVSLVDNQISGTGQLLLVEGGDATIQIDAGTGVLQGTGIQVVDTTGGSLSLTGAALTSDGNTAVVLDNNAATITLTDLAIERAAGDTAFAIDTLSGGSTGDITLAGTSTLDDNTGSAFVIGAGARNMDASQLNLTSTDADNSLIIVSGQSGGLLDFGDILSTGSTADNVIISTAQTAGTLRFGDVTINDFNQPTGTAVELAGDGTVAFDSLELNNATGGGLLASGVTLQSTAQISIESNQGVALILDDVKGDLDLTLSSADAANEAVRIENLQAGNSIRLEDVDILNAGTSGVIIDNIAGDLLLAGITSISGAGLHGLVVDGLSGSLDITDLQVDQVAGHGASFGGSTANSGEISIAAGTIDSADYGIYAINTALTLNALRVGGNDPVNNGAIVLISNDAINRRYQLTDNQLTALGSGLVLTHTGSGDVQLALDGTEVDAGGAGISLDGSAATGDLLITSFDGNSVSQAGAGGILIETAVFDADPLTAGFQSVVGGNTQIGDLLATGNITGDGLRLNNVLGDIAFGTLNISNNTGTGLFIRDAEGKVGTFNFGNTGGAINTQTGAAIDIDPVTMASTFASVRSVDSAGAGILIDTISGSIEIGETSIINAATDGIAIIDSEGDFSFGDTLIDQAGNDGVRLAGSSGVILFGAMTLEDITRTGVNFGEFSGDFTAQSLDLDGAVTAIDLTNAGGVIVFTDGGLLQNFSGTGVQLSSTDDIADSADADFTFGGGNINAGVGAFFIDGIGLDATKGLYDFTGVSFTGNARLPASGSGQVGDLYFVSSAGTGDGSTTGSAAGLADAQARADSGLLTTFVFINDGSPIDFSSLADGSFKLSAGQAVSGFGNGNAFGLLVPANLLGDFGDVSINDPTGNGAAVLTSTTGNVLTLSDNNFISNLSLSGGLNSLYGDGFSGLTVQNTSFTAAANYLFNLNNAAGTILIRDNAINNVTGQLLSLNGGNANLTLQAGTGTLSGYGVDMRNTTGGSLAITGASLNANGAAALTLNGNVAPVTLTDVSLAATTAHYLFDIDRTTASTGTINLGNSTLGSFSGGAAYIGAGARTIDASGFDIVAGDQSNVLIDIRDQSGGTISFGDITSTGQTSATVRSIFTQGQSAGALNFGNVSISNFNIANGRAVDLFSTSGNLGTTRFANLDVSAIQGDAFSAANSGLTILDGSLQTLSGLGLRLVGVDVGVDGVNLDLVSAVINDGVRSVVQISTSSGNVTLGSVSGSSAGTDMVDLSTNTGTYRFDSLDLTYSGTGIAFDATNTGNLIVNNAGAGINSTSGQALRIIGTAVSGSGFSQITRSGIAAGSAVVLTNNTGTTRLNGVNVNGSGTVFSVSNAGTLEVLGSTNTITTNANSSALNVANTTIGAGGLNFRSISSSGGVNGIVLTNTGAVGGLNVTGVGTTVGSGGTISATTGSGIVMTNAVNARFNGMIITGAGSHGVDAAALSGLTAGANAFTFSNGQILNAAGDGINMTRTTTNISGGLTLTNVLFDGYARNGLWVSNQTLNTIVNMNGVTFRNANALTNDQAALFVAALNGTAGFNITVRDSTFGSAFGSGIASICCSGITLNAEGSGTFNLDVADSLFQNVSRANSGSGIVATATQTADMTVLINNNQFTDIDASSIAIGAFDGSEVNATLTNNLFNGVNNTPSLAMRLVGDGGVGNANFTGRFLISGNTVTGLENGILALSRNTNAGRMDVNILNNTINTNSVVFQESILLNTVTATAQMCVNVQGNSITHGGPADDIGILPQLGSTILVTQASPAAISTANGGASVYTEGNITYNVVCQTPQ
ncbi:MAG: hypothetical protein CVV07_11525 [Gammaproteobacteria bacterium HGW-Gammaproteobacteria-11]|nr:MAG: hypothetical protein CVV07_11525 [Gammaproteobacteria bacterium HGW-Gammaproteobacteria-11]